MINPETLLSTETDWVTCIHCPQAKSQDGTLSTINCKRTIFPEKKKYPLSSWDLLIVEATWVLYYPLDR